MRSDHRLDPLHVVALKDRAPSEAVVRAVAETADADPADLPLLQAVIDPDSLDALFQGRAAGSVTFEYAGYAVTVQANAEVVVQEAPSIQP